MTADGTFRGQTVHAVRRILAARFRDAGITSAELDARLLAGHLLSLDLTGLIAAAARCVNDSEAAQLEDHARRRIAGEPVARIIGIKEFWSLPLRLAPATLVPRPDTETVVEAALDSLPSGLKREAALRLADLGTGSGAILLALLSELAGAFGIGTDLSEAALQVARSNARRLGLAPRAGFLACDYGAALAGPFDLIVSNPPYIRSAEIALLDIEVRDHEPRAALDGGADGLDAYRAIVPQARRLLAPGGVLVMEVGAGHSGAVEALIAAAGLAAGPLKRDLSGIPRAVTGLLLPR